MRIGMLTTGYPHALDPVSGAFVRAMAQALAARGHAVRVLCAHKPGDSPARDPGVRVLPVRYAPREEWEQTFYGPGAPDRLARGGAEGLAAWGGALGFPLALWVRAARALAGCDALVSHFVLPCGAVGAAVRGNRAHLCVAHGTDAWWFARSPRWAQRAVLAGTTALRFTNAGPWAACDARVRGDQRVSVGPTGYFPAPVLDERARAHARRELGADDGDVVVLGLGRMVALKGFDTLVEAAGMLGRGCVLALAGDGPERGRLSARARALDLRVCFAGAVDAARRDELLRAADVFVAPSRPLPDGRTEGAPVSVLEAMGAGLAVVASRAGGLPELLGDAGVLVPPDDAWALGSALRTLVGDGALRAALGARALARAEPWAWSAQAAWVERVLARGGGGVQQGPV